MLLPVPAPDPLYFYKAVPGTRVFCRGRTELPELPKGSGTGMDVVRSLLKGRVLVYMSYQAYQRVGYGYGCFTKLTKGSGMVRLLVPVRVPDPGYIDKAVPGTRVSYRGRTKLTKVSGTGVEVVPSLPKYRVRVIQGVRTPGTRWYIHYLTHIEIVVYCLLRTHAVGSVLISCY